MLVFWVGKRGEKAWSVLAIAKFPFFGDLEFPIEKKGYERQKRDKNVFVQRLDKIGIFHFNFVRKIPSITFKNCVYEQIAQICHFCPTPKKQPRTKTFLPHFHFCPHLYI